MGRRSILAVVAVVVALGAGAYALIFGTSDYTVKIVVPSAAQLLQGSPIWIDGVHAGSVESLQVSNGKAIIEASLSHDFAPLHDGTTSRVEWNSVAGERMLTLYPGPSKNPVIPNGAMFAGDSKQIEVDQILAMLDKPTRDRLVSLIGELDDTTSGQEQELRATLASAGPAVNALGEVLKGIGQDGPAIRDLVTELDKMTAVAATHSNDVSGTVNNLTTITGAMAQKQSQLSDSLKELPPTLQEAESTLDRVPAAGDATIPLLHDLKPATSQLASVSRNLSPVLQDLRPVVADLRPTLAAAQELLGQTPGLLDTAHQVLPPVRDTLISYAPAVAFLRPYTPELIGWLHNFGQSFAEYDSQGHYWAATVAPGTNALNESLVQLPGSYTSARPYPGSVVGQSWTDAHGSGMR
ncbi:MlaD family protein [Candidatus Protofrankia californiensis]|uniref:MlaD family protein n=1 Tax=Candidatus Protofrankia californiensis TaxID=1839754 RepID=UPI001041B8B5|nr:MCE family protein [Candidatus Protofrankia californiensis]